MSDKKNLILTSINDAYVGERDNVTIVSDGVVIVKYENVKSSNMYIVTRNNKIYVPLSFDLINNTITFVVSEIKTNDFSDCKCPKSKIVIDGSNRSVIDMKGKGKGKRKRDNRNKDNQFDNQKDSQGDNQKDSQLDSQKDNQEGNQFDSQESGQ